MASGVTGNSMGTVSGMRIIFSDGTVLDTRDKTSREAFLANRGDTVERITALSQSLRSEPETVERIRRKYRIKNTTGYSVNALIDFDDPIDMIQHLIIGSEGTLGFISEVTFRTLDEPTHKATSLMLFPDIAKACEAVLLLKDCQVSAAELMDRTALRSVESKEGMPAYMKTLGDSVTALLVGPAAASPGELQRHIEEINSRFDGFAMAREFFLFDRFRPGGSPVEYPQRPVSSACIGRKKGTTVIIEDIAVPIEHLQSCLLDLQVL